ncbi:TetR/AcrR family transcriptional regulator [Streptomyces sp. NPDC006175]|uniref:TetR/AcrR family transcriptional regulator n=1 Tax=unclassified Streptomyces TaxID=2593676 RepID=UPI0033AA89BD
MKNSEDDPIGPRRDRILAVAAEEFEKKGFAGARIDEIARRSNVNKQLIYYYFESKRVLHSKVMEHVTIRALEETHYESDESYVKSIQRLCAASFSRIRNRLYRYWLWEAVESFDQGGIARRDERQSHYKKRVDHIRKGQVDGEIDPDIDARFLHLAITAIISFPHMTPHIASLVTGLESDDPEFREGQQEFLEQLMQRLRPPSA